MLTCRAKGPGDVEVEVVGSVDGHVQVLVGLQTAIHHNLIFTFSFQSTLVRSDRLIRSTRAASTTRLGQSHPSA